MFGRKSRGQVIGEELSEGFSHVRTAANEATKAAAEALAPRVEAARGAVNPRVEATREAITKGFDTAKGQAEDRLAAAREQADARRAEVVDASRRSAKKSAKRAKKNAKRAKKTAVGARKDAKVAVADAKAQAKEARGAKKRRRRWPWLLAIAGVIGAVVAKNRAKTDDDLWGAPSDSPVRGYTEDPHPSTVAAKTDGHKEDHVSDTPATEDPYPGTTADQDGTVAEKTDDYKAVAPTNDGPLHGKLADSAHDTGTTVGDTPAAQDDTWSEMIEGTKDSDDGPNAAEAAKHAALSDKEAPKKRPTPRAVRED